MGLRFHTIRHVLARLAHRLNRRSVRTLLVVVVMGALLWKIDRAQLRDSLSDFDPLIGALLLVVNLVLTGLFAWRWCTIARALGVSAPFRLFARAIWVSQCVSELGPALIVGELARFQQLRRHADNWPLAVSQILDRLSGKVILLLIVAILTPLYLDWLDSFPAQQVGFLMAVLIAGITLVAVLLRRFWPIARLHPRRVIALCNPFKAPGHYGLSLIIQLLLASNLALSALGIGASEGIASRVFLLGPLVLLGVGALPGLVSDWGKREALAMVILAPSGLTTEQRLAVSLIFGSAHLFAVLPAALLLWSRRPPPAAGEPLDGSP
ncbi:lysylphosphatidylglycerol synthase transmembrane domain-containing protein [Methylolobus aquaticus]